MTAKSRGDVPLPSPSCPSGYTHSDLDKIFEHGGLPEFYRWMSGQTATICNGKRWHYIRGHSKCPEDKAGCQKGFNAGDDPCIAHCGHDDDSTEHDWKCEYFPGGYEEPTECADHPHGMVTYSWDVERFFCIKKGAPDVWD